MQDLRHVRRPIVSAGRPSIIWIKSKMTTLKRAIEIATQAHAGQVDKAGADYIGHPLRVMMKGETVDEKIAGVLHDVVEDTDWTFEMLEEEGLSSEVVEALRCVTKLSDDESYDDFIDRVLTNQLAMRVKLHDLEDNMDLARLDELTDADSRGIRNTRKLATVQCLRI